MTVEENLLMGGFIKDKSEESYEEAEKIFEKYDRLRKRRNQPQLSGSRFLCRPGLGFPIEVNGGSQLGAGNKVGGTFHLPLGRLNSHRSRLKVKIFIERLRSRSRTLPRVSEKQFPSSTKMFAITVLAPGHSIELNQDGATGAMV